MVLLKALRISVKPAGVLASETCSCKNTMTKEKEKPQTSGKCVVEREQKWGRHLLPSPIIRSNVSHSPFSFFLFFFYFYFFFGFFSVGASN